MPFFRILRTLCLVLATSVVMLSVSARPAAAQVVFQAAGPNAAAIQPTVDAFRANLGTLNANVAGSFNQGRREINWDGVPDAFSAPNNFPGNFFNTNSPRGVVTTTPGTGFQVSANAANPPVRFGNIDPSYPTIFQVFSSPRLFTALGSTITDVNFFIPGTSTPALTRGFGSVFTDVDVVGSTTIQYFDANGASLGTFPVPATAGNQTFSFLGVSFTNPVISRVRITSGNQVLAPGNTSDDLVVMDDFIYGEPQTVPTLQFSSPAYSVAENGGAAAITITRKGGLSGPVSVDLSTVNGTAFNGVDYLFAPPTQTINFANGQASATVNIPIINDNVSEGTENFVVILSNPQPPGSATLAAPILAVVSILDNDVAPTLSINNVTQAEGNVGTTNFVFTVTLSSPSASTITVNFQTANGTATAGVDYIAQAGQLVFAPGVTSLPISVPVFGDTLFEGNETFFVDLTWAAGITPPPPPNVRGTGTIVNDDPAPTLDNNDTRVREGEVAVFTVTLSNAAGVDVLVDYSTADGPGPDPAIAGVDYVPQIGQTLTIPAGQLKGTIQVQTINDDECEPNKTFSVNLSNARAQTTPPTPLFIGIAQGVATICDEDGAQRLVLERIGPEAAFLGLTPTERFVRATAFNGCDEPVPGVPVFFEVTGINPQEGTIETDENGVALLPVVGRFFGFDELTAQALTGCQPFGEPSPIVFNFLVPPPGSAGSRFLAQGNGAVKRLGSAGTFVFGAGVNRGKLGGDVAYFDGPTGIQLRTQRVVGIISDGRTAVVFGLGFQRFGRLVRQVQYRLTVTDGGTLGLRGDTFGLELSATAFANTDVPPLTPITTGNITIRRSR